MPITIQDKFSLLWVKAVNSRIGSSLMLLVLLVQRSPIVKWVAEAEFSLSNRIIQSMPYAVATLVATTTTHHAVSGASGDLIIAQGSSTTITGTVGEPIEWYFQVDQGRENISAYSYNFQDPVPNGISVEPLRDSRNRLVKNAGVISGIPTQAGEWTFRVHVWEKENFKGENKIANPTLKIVISPAIVQVDPIVDMFGADLTGDPKGWAFNSWFGWFFAETFPYVQHLQQGGLYLFPSAQDGSSIWLFSPQMGYLWASKNSFPSGYLYSANKGNWLLFIGQFGELRWYYDFSINDYISVTAN